MALIDNFFNTSTGLWNEELLWSYWDHMKSRIQYSDEHFYLFGQIMQKAATYTLSEDTAYRLLDVWSTMTFDVDTIQWRRFSPTRTNSYLPYFVEKHPNIMGKYLESRKLGKGLDERFPMHAVMLLWLLHQSKDTVNEALQEQFHRLTKRTLRTGAGLGSLPSYTDLLPLQMLYEVAQTQDKPTSKALQLWAANVLAKQIQRTCYTPEVEHPEGTWLSIEKTAPEVLQWALQGNRCKQALEVLLGKPNKPSSDTQGYISNVRILQSQLSSYLNNSPTNAATRMAAEVIWQNFMHKHVHEVWNTRSKSGNALHWTFAKIFGHIAEAASNVVDNITNTGWCQNDLLSDIAAVMLFKEHPIAANLIQEARKLSITALLRSLDIGDSSNKPQIIKHLEITEISDLLRHDAYPNEDLQFKEMLFWNLLYGGYLSNEVLESLGQEPHIQTFIFGKTFLDSVGVHDWKSHSSFDSAFERPWLNVLQRLYPATDWGPVRIALFDNVEKGDYLMLQTVCTTLNVNYEAVLGLQSIYAHNWKPKTIQYVGGHQFERVDDFQCGWLAQEGWLADFHHSVRNGVVEAPQFNLPNEDLESSTSLMTP